MIRHPPSHWGVKELPFSLYLALQTSFTGWIGVRGTRRHSTNFRTIHYFNDKYFCRDIAFEKWETREGIEDGQYRLLLVRRLRPAKEFIVFAATSDRKIPRCCRLYNNFSPLFNRMRTKCATLILYPGDV